MKKKTEKEFLKDVKEKKGERYSILSPYINNKTKILVRCEKCKNEYFVRPDNFLNKDNDCKICESKSRFSIKNFKNFLENKFFYYPIMEEQKIQKFNV